MTVIGMTASIGMGKSTVSNMFRERNVPVFDMDAETHRIRGPHGVALAELEALIPGSTTPETGIDRDKLRAFAFADPTNIDKLDAILKPYLVEELEKFVDTIPSEGLGLLDIPLLFEKGLDKYADVILVLNCPPDVQMERVLARGLMSSVQVAEILRRQMPNAEKLHRADYVIDTGCSLEETERLVSEFIDTIL